MARPAASGRLVRKPTRRARGSMSREDILAGARELIERHGLRELSMPGAILRRIEDTSVLVRAGLSPEQGAHVSGVSRVRESFAGLAT